ncbi:XRE family transcriptional regulator [Microlunatus aurantiacus]|uniref:XRE family transcriptional regulator n=1 Tax=Microlunatus aurantiacus TaxID=446786 RepID=A0ABP7DNT6_9ACTN
MTGDFQRSLFSESEEAAADVVTLFEPARLTQARVLAGMTKKELAAAVGVSPTAVSQYESGLTHPRPRLLLDLARVLGHDVRFFAGGRPLARVDTGDAHFRSLRSLRAADRDRALATAEQVWELVCALERHVHLPEVNLPSDVSDATPRAAAQAVRKHWRLPRGPVKHLVATMELNGVVVVLSHEDSGIDRVDAFSTVIADRPIVISTPRRSNDVYRHRFTCAHELGHLVLHQGQPAENIAAERQADEFAAEFLTPEGAMRSLLPSRMDLAALSRLAQTWGVSPDSLIRRMSELRMVSDVTIRRAYVRLNAVRELAGTSPIHRYEGEVPTMLRRAIALTQRVGVGPRELAAELRWQPDRIHDLIGGGDTRPKLTLA